ncbi:DUF429 domain-containing protein [Paracoccus stylophorae]|uniref:DUF429 domain-containing protein n=1 Tax=Paracoccus stylophorae TaxID=659350 RepID=A0ABY7STL6_9RHOB|nr:DUF429 domain-containing protein [Paracoccus stylophorae]WCR10288.1 DUF429 domain-containing protein [Paracoccus stylophorae]
MKPDVVVHCDWSKDAAKRWQAKATRDGGSWRLELPQRVGSTEDVLDRMREGAKPGRLFAGFDFPIGLPLTYGARTGLDGFREAVEAFGCAGAWQDWFAVCDDASQISLHRPFYPMRPGGRRLAHLLDGLALDGVSARRLCERRTASRPAACMLFWTLGGNQVGKAAATGWQEILKPNLPRIGLWPFDGDLHSLLAQRDIVVAETYPGEVYDHLGIPRRPVWSKRKQAGRASVGGHLLARTTQRGHGLAEGLADVIRNGFSDRADGEDQFDALVGLLGMLDVVDGHRPEGAPRDPAISGWEGWILGQQHQAASG